MNGLSAHHEALLEQLGLFVDSLLVEQFRQVMYDQLAAEVSAKALGRALDRVMRERDAARVDARFACIERDEARAGLAAAEARLRAALGTVQS